jgi:hypothetical protein
MVEFQINATQQALSLQRKAASSAYLSTASYFQEVECVTGLECK